MLVIDCHAHIYSPDEERYPPVAQPLRVPGGGGSIQDLRAVMRRQRRRGGPGRPDRLLLRIRQPLSCRRLPREPRPGQRAVHVGSRRSAKSGMMLWDLVQKHGIKALRSIPAESRTRFDHPAVRRLWQAAHELGITVDIFLMQMEWVEGAERLLREFSHLTVAFCHCLDLKPGEEYREKLEAVLRLARFPNLIAKVDFISTGTEKGFPGDDLHEAALRIIDAYGAERCVWGSNYPNRLWTPKMSYAEHLRIFREVLPLKEEDRRQILGETARRLWFPEL